MLLAPSPGPGKLRRVWWTRYWRTTITYGFGISIVRRYTERRGEFHLVLGAHHFMLAHRDELASRSAQESARWRAREPGTSRFQILAEGTDVQFGMNPQQVAVAWLKSIFLDGQLHKLALNVMRDVGHDDWSDVNFIDGPTTAQLWMEAVAIFRDEGIAATTDQHTRREIELQLWVGRAVAGKMTLDPEGVLHHAYRNIGRMRLGEGGASDEVLAEWQALLEAGAEATMATLTSPTAGAIRLRAQSPFRRVLSRKEHAMVLNAFDKYWRMRART